jgi:HEAT repeat protein
MNTRLVLGAGVLIAILAITVQTGAAQSAWHEIARLLSLEGPAVASSANILSEHEIETLDGSPPQQQAELLLERAINHYQGANEQIAARVDGWRGKIELKGRLNSLFGTALNASDLRVRAAAIEVDIAARNVEKSAAFASQLRSSAMSSDQGERVNALWNLALIGNRGIEPEATLPLLLEASHDSNQNIRYWGVEGLAYLGDPAAIPRLLEVFHDDPSPQIRERAACSLAQSGMFNEEQRRSAVPRLLDFADDSTLDDQTRRWVFQALRDITGQSLGHDAAAWRAWHNRQR